MDGMPEQTPSAGMPPGGEGVTGQAGQRPPPQEGGMPAGSPMSTPTKKAGEQQAAKMWVAHVALPALEKALSVLGSTSEQGQAILAALKALSKDFGEGKDQDLGLNSMAALLGRRQK